MSNIGINKEFHDFGKFIEVAAILTIVSIVTGFAGFIAMIFIFVAMASLKRVNYTLNNPLLHEFRSKYIKAFVSRICGTVVLMIGGANIAIFFFFPLALPFYISLSVSAILSGSLIALNNSVVITPSLMRIWKVKPQANLSAPFEVDVPIKLLSEEVIPYRDYILKRIEDYQEHPEKMTSTIKYNEIENGWVISFVYKSTTSMTGNFYTSNNLYITKSDNSEYTVVLMSRGESEWAHDIGTLIRLFSMDFSTQKNVTD